MNKGVIIAMFGFIFLLLVSFFVLLTMVVSNSVSEYMDNRDDDFSTINEDGVHVTPVNNIPRITLEEDYIELEYGADYVLPTAVAYDEEDGSLPVVVRSTLDTHKWGVQNIVYEACDNDNQCTYKTVTIFVESPKYQINYEQAWNRAKGDTGISVQLKSAEYMEEYLLCEMYLFNRNDQTVDLIKSLYIVIKNDEGEIITQAVYEDIITTINVDSYEIVRLQFKGEQLKISQDDLDVLTIEYSVEYRYLYQEE